MKKLESYIFFSWQIEGCKIIKRWMHDWSGGYMLNENFVLWKKRNTKYVACRQGLHVSLTVLFLHEGVIQFQSASGVIKRKTAEVLLDKHAPYWSSNVGCLGYNWRLFSITCSYMLLHNFLILLCESCVWVCWVKFMYTITSMCLLKVH